jgi:signal transduction histidine kinase
MIIKDKPIQQQLMTVVLVITGAALLLTCVAFFVYEFFAFRQTTVRELTTLGEIIASNSTAALAFDNRDDANEILAALKAEKHIVAASLYDKTGQLFSQYPATLAASAFPTKPQKEGYQFEDGFLVSFQPVAQGTRTLGVLYLKSDMGAMYERFRLYGGIALGVVAVSFLLAYLLSRSLAQRISNPILALAETAKAISERHDYSVRATKMGNDEIGSLTDSFNLMLIQIQEQNREIKSFNQMLEQKVLERTNEMEMINKELEAFSYSISHDLRAPLRSIIGYSQVLLEDYGEKMDDEGKRVSKVIINNGKRMGQLIDDLLDFSRLGRTELQRTYVDMDALVKEILQEQTSHENGRKLDIRVLPLEPSKVDRNMLTQVWINLISNALKYSRKREVAEIEIGSRREGDKTCYYVSDNGAGFDMLYVDKLFGVFQRLHKMNEFEGTGVGLALVKRIVQRHGGNVWAESAIDKGARFYFTLPNS